MRKKHPGLFKGSAAAIAFVLVAAITAMAIVPAVVSAVDDDPWADYVYDWFNTDNPGNALHAPDEYYAVMHGGFWAGPPGYLELGMYQPIVNHPGVDDFRVYGYGYYEVFGGSPPNNDITTSVTNGWVSLGTGFGTTDFDLDGLSYTDYIRIEMLQVKRIFACGIDAVEDLGPPATPTPTATATPTATPTPGPNFVPEPEITSPEDQDPCGAAPLSGLVPLVAVDNGLDQGADIEYVMFWYYYDKNQNCDDDDDGSAWVEMDVEADPEDGTWVYYWDTTAVDDCCYLVRVYMEDEGGLYGWSEWINIALSNHAPDPVFLNPPYGDTLSGLVWLEVEDNSFEGSADIAGHNCCSFWYCYDPDGDCDVGECSPSDWQPIGQACEPDANGVWRIQWDTTTVQDCFYILRATMVDKHGLEGSGYINVGVGNETPVADITLPYDSDPQCAASVSGIVTIEVMETLGATDLLRATFEYCYDPDQECDCDEGYQWTLIGVDDTPEYGYDAVSVNNNGVQHGFFEIDWDTTGLDDCCYLIRASIEDKHGLTSDYDTICVAVSNHTPVPVIIDPPDGCFENPALSGTVTIKAIDTSFEQGADIDIDATPTPHGFVTFKYRPAGDDCQSAAAWTAMGTPTQGTCNGDRCWSVDWDTTQLDDCCYQITVVMGDKHGLESVEDDAIICVGVGNDPPVADITLPYDADPQCGNAYTVSGDVTIEVVDALAATDLHCACFYYCYDPDQNCICDGGSEWVFIVCDYTPADGFTATWPTDGLPDCCYLIKATLTDKHGLIDEDTICVAVSNHLEPKIIDPDDGNPCHGVGANDPVSGTLTITAIDESLDQGTDIDLGVHGSVTFYYWDDLDQDCEADEEGNWVEITGVTQGTCNGDRCWSVDWDTTQVPDECYIIKVEMTDKHGLTADSYARGSAYAVNVLVNNHPPAPHIAKIKYNETVVDTSYGCGDVPCGVTLEIVVTEKNNATDISTCWLMYYDRASQDFVDIGEDTTIAWDPDQGHYYWSVTWDPCLPPYNLEPYTCVIIMVWMYDKTPEAWGEWYAWDFITLYLLPTPE